MGRIRTRLAKLLCAAGLDVAPEDFWIQEGGYRHHHWDLACWGVAPKAKQKSISSFDTMTACVRYGIVIDRDYSGDIQISRK